MTNYQIFLNKIEIISESEFNDLLESLPEVHIENINFFDINEYVDDGISRCCVARFIIDTILRNKWAYVYVEDIDTENKIIWLEDVDSLKDLEEIKNYFPKWNIENYDAIKNKFKKQEEREYNDLKLKIFKSGIDNVSLEEVKAFINDHKK